LARQLLLFPFTVGGGTTKCNETPHLDLTFRFGEVEPDFKWCLHLIDPAQHANKDYMLNANRYNHPTSFVK
jgi:hypothetical protein